MGTKYYHALNCNRGFQSGVEFRPYSNLGGTWWGVFATDDEAQQRYLDSLATNKETAVTVVTEDDFDKAIVQASGNAGLYSPTPQPYNAPKAKPAAGLKIADKAGVVDENPEPPEAAPVATGEPIANVSEAMVVGKVETGAAAETTAPAKPKKAKPQQAAN